jgi:photosystem II stability/assembly factor-like uncharacterized protein
MFIFRFKSLLFLLVILVYHVNSQPHWTSQISGTARGLNAVTFFDSLTGIAVGDSGTVLRSEDGGINWSSQFDGNPFQSYHTLKDIEKTNSNSSIIIGEYLIYDAMGSIGFRTSNKGIDWISAEVGGSSVSFANEEQGIVFSYWWDFIGELRTGTNRTTNGGLTWESYHPHLNNRWMSNIINDVAFIDTNFCISISEDGCVLKMVKDSMGQYYGYSFWNMLDSLSHGLRSIHFIDTTIGFISGGSGVIYKTTDGGQSWLQKPTGTGQQLNNIYFLSTNEGYAVGAGGIMLHTTDVGENWALESTGTNKNRYKIFFTDPAHGWAVGENGTILKYGEFTACHIADKEINYGKLVEREIKADSVLISNTGTNTIIVSNISSDNSEFILDKTELTLPPSTSERIQISFSPLSPGLKNGHMIFTHNAPSSPDTVFVEGIALDYDTAVVTVNAKWNLVSNPQLADNDSTHVLFPTAISKTYRYDQTLGYQESPRIENGIGYWIKFNSYEEFNISGVVNTIDTIEVKEGWNLIGSISDSIATSGIIQVPTNIVDSEYFGFEEGYKIADVIIPGKAYWVKVNMNGKLILLSP